LSICVFLVPNACGLLYAPFVAHAACFYAVTINAFDVSLLVLLQAARSQRGLEALHGLHHDDLLIFSGVDAYTHSLRLSSVFPAGRTRMSETISLFVSILSSQTGSRRTSSRSLMSHRSSAMARLPALSTSIFGTQPSGMRWNRKDKKKCIAQDRGKYPERRGVLYQERRWDLSSLCGSRPWQASPACHFWVSCPMACQELWPALIGMVGALTQRCFASACTPHKLHRDFTRRRRRRKYARVTRSRYAYFGLGH
jgi:hypothetical protein